MTIVVMKQHQKGTNHQRAAHGNKNDVLARFPYEHLSKSTDSAALTGRVCHGQLRNVCMSTYALSYRGIALLPLSSVASLLL